MSVGKADQVTDGAVNGDETLIDRRHADLKAVGEELPAERLRQGQNVSQAGDPLPVNGLKKLRAPVAGLPLRPCYLCKFLKGKA